jgi:DNA-binding NtrC family response regulator
MLSEERSTMNVPQRLLRVFVVDDEDVIASSLAMVLRFQGGIHARSFNQPLEALRAAQVEAPDVLITDLWMPQLSGIDLAVQLQDICPACKVLLFSGHATAGPLLDAARTNGYKFEFLSKPVHPATLMARIQELTAPAELLPFPDGTDSGRNQAARQALAGD